MPRDGVLDVRGAELGQPGQLDEVVGAAAEDPACGVVLVVDVAVVVRAEDSRGIELAGRDRVLLPEDGEGALEALTTGPAVEVQLVQVVGDGLETGPDLGDEVEAVPGGDVCRFEGRLGACLGGADQGGQLGVLAEDIAYGLVQLGAGVDDEVEALEDRKGRFVAGEILDQGWRRGETSGTVRLDDLYDLVDIEGEGHVRGERDDNGVYISC